MSATCSHVQCRAIGAIDTMYIGAFGNQYLTSGDIAV